MTYFYTRTIRTLITGLALSVGLSGFAQNWNEILKVSSSDRAIYDLFGCSVSISGNYAIIGAQAEDEDTAGANIMIGAGSAYIFQLDTSGVWNEIQKIVASDRATGDGFGYSVSMSNAFVVVGARGEDLNSSGANDAGAAYIFERDSLGIWNEVQKIVASDRSANDSFGSSVSLSGNYISIGAPDEDHDTTGGSAMSNAGSAYIFERNNAGTWNEVQKIVASDRGANDFFGWAISISGDHTIIGAFREDEDTAGGNTMSSAGAAYIYARDPSGVWNESQKIVASDRANDDAFGRAVSISGSYAVVGATFEDEDAVGSNTMSTAGSAYIFELDSLSNWNEVQKIVASDRAASDEFAISVAISGTYIIIGATREDEDASGNNTMAVAGSAYVFELNTFGSWNEVRKIVASDRAPIDQFGNSVSIDGDYAFLGAFQEDEDPNGLNTMNNSGSVYIFKTDCRLFGTISDSICNRDTIYVNGTAYSYANPTGTEVFTNIGPDLCDSTVTINLTVMNAIDTSTHVSGLVITSNQVGANYQWIDCTNGNSLISGATDSSYTATNNGAYAVIVTMGNCSDTSACVSINSICTSQSNFMVSSIDSMTFNFTDVSTGIYSDVHWAFGDGTTSTLSNPSHTYSVNGTYLVVLTLIDLSSNGDSCTSYKIDTVSAFNSVNPSSCQAGYVIVPDTNAGQINVYNTSQGFGLSYSWDFGDGTSSTNQNPSHTYAGNGPYYLCLTVSDGLGCTDVYCDSVGAYGVFYKTTGFQINVSNPLMLNTDEFELNRIQLYPNPTDGDFIIDLGKNYESVKVSITDLTGRLVQSSTYNECQLLELKFDEPAGIYLLRIESGYKKIDLRLVKK